MSNPIPFAEQPPPLLAQLATPDAPQPPPSAAPVPPTLRKRGRGSMIAIIVLSLALVGALVAFGWNSLRLHVATVLLEQQQVELDEQRELIDEKTTFGAAMHLLVDEANAFEGIPFTSLIDWYGIESIATRGWTNRWDLEALRHETRIAEDAHLDLVALRDQATAEAAVNSSGTVYESTLDRLGKGFVRTAIDDADALCAKDVLGCVSSDDPLLVHIDAADVDLPHLTDWLRTGLAYHEYAHVLQFTNPEATAIAAGAFGGDFETMADCYALTYLEGWTLTHRVPINRSSWWEVDMGYGHVCDGAQQQAVRDWIASLGVAVRTVEARAGR